MALKKISELNPASSADVTSDDSIIINDGSTTKRVSLSNLISGSNAEIRSLFSASGDLSYNLSTGEFSVTVPDGYDSSDFDTDFSGKSTSDLSEGTNLYYTDARVDAHLSGGTGVTFSNGVISVGQSVETTDNVTFNDVTVSGDLTVSGTTTTLNTTTLDVEDINITVANGATSASSANGAGLTADLGSDGSATFTYDSANDRWSMNKTLDTNLIGDVTGIVSDISNHDTDDLTEGTSNLYYTDTRARNALSASGDLSYDSATGTISFTERTDSEVRNLFSAAGDLNYNSSTGEFSVTVPAGYDSTDFDTDFNSKSTDDLSEGTNLYYTDARVDAHLSGGSGIDFSTGTISHADTSSQSSVNNSGSTFIQDITVDGFGHITGINSGSVSGFAQENTSVTFTTVTADDFNSTSDVRRKTNVETLTDPLTKVSNLRGVSFDWTESGESSIGLIAQELEEVIPEVVSTGEDGLKSVSYGNLVGLLIEAIKDQQNQIDELKNKVYK